MASCVGVFLGDMDVVLGASFYVLALGSWLVPVLTTDHHCFAIWLSTLDKKSVLKMSNY